VIDFGHSAMYGYVATGLLASFGLVRLGHHVLDLLRDWRRFREGN
jgi:hypothetical protein